MIKIEFSFDKIIFKITNKYQIQKIVPLRISQLGSVLVESFDVFHFFSIFSPVHFSFLFPKKKVKIIF